MTDTPVTPLDATMQFVETVFKPFKFQWSLSDPIAKIPGVHARGIADGAVVDVVCRDGRCRLISMAMRLAPESTLLMVHVLSAIRKDAQYGHADAWLAATIKMLPQNKPGVKIRPWGDWQVEVTSTAIGLFTMIIKPRTV